ncbi:MAG: hypothetical protein EA402_14575 [Planctomycetota bacterium]|nr:MAG: hypothetical protein EA402_14575 [Planctomycetota bacterium]
MPASLGMLLAKKQPFHGFFPVDLEIGPQWREAKAKNQGKPAARVLFSLAHWSAPVPGWP